MPNDTVRTIEKAKLEAEILAAAASSDAVNLGVLGLGLEEKVRLLADILREQAKQNSNPDQVLEQRLQNEHSEHFKRLKP